jgi:DNA (cytosine-5)-methyltransferase 1
MHNGVNTTLDEGQTLIAFDCKGSQVQVADDGSHPTLRSMGHHKSHQNAGGHAAICFDTTQITSPSNYSQPKPGDPCHPLAASAHPPAVAVQEPLAMNNRDSGARNVSPDGWAVRRLTPRECERLQAFGDDFTRIPWRGKPAEKCPDGLRYKAIGNSMAVNVMEWIGQRIDAVDKELLAA